ncbi:MAG: MotA/TolQ/ExbB proton channel family protein [Rhodospirillaceae bacterium]|nr:MotA/TolQ/ExbB proton channel family protein [Rhodospirillaceae bacterium]
MEIDLFGAIQRFMERGGPVLYIIGVTTFFMWVLIVERYIYFSFNHRKVCQDALDAWHARTDHHSWIAHKIRDKLISNTRLEATSNLLMVTTLVALCPLEGLLGTVTGMVTVFDVMALTGSSNPRAMASGVSQSTVPTMSGMVAALSGMYFRVQLARRAEFEVKQLADQLEIEHK